MWGDMWGVHPLRGRRQTFGSVGCLAAASYNASAPSTPRLDSDASIGAVLGDGSVALVFAQATHYRDCQGFLLAGSRWCLSVVVVVVVQW